MLSKFKRGLFYSVDTLTNVVTQSHNLNGIYFWLLGFSPNSVKEITPVWLLPLLPDVAVVLLGLKHSNYCSKLSELNIRIEILKQDLKALLEVEDIKHDSATFKLMQKKYLEIKRDQNALMSSLRDRINSIGIAALQQFLIWVSHYLKYYSFMDGSGEAESFDNLMLYLMIASSAIFGYSVATSPRHKIENLFDLDCLYQQWEKHVLKDTQPQLVTEQAETEVQMVEPAGTEIFVVADPGLNFMEESRTSPLARKIAWSPGVFSEEAGARAGSAMHVSNFTKGLS